MTPPLKPLVVTISDSTIALEAGNPPAGSPVFASDRTESNSLFTTLTSFLAAPLSTAGETLLRRAGFFAGKQGGILEELNPPPADPLQSCTSVNVSGGPISFGNVPHNTSATRYFTISNPNCCPVSYTVSGGGYGFSISPVGGSIPANGSVSIGVTFTPPSVQYYSGTANITPSGSISFTGNGT